MSLRRFVLPRMSRYLMLLLLVVLCAHCQDPTGPDPGGTVKMRIDGRAWEARLALANLNAGVFDISAADDEGQILSIRIYGPGNGDVNAPSMRVGLAGEFTFSPNVNGNSVDFAAGKIGEPDSWSMGTYFFGNPSGGTLTITQFTATTVSGTFAFKLLGYGSGVVPITHTLDSGTFEITLCKSLPCSVR